MKPFATTVIERRFMFCPIGVLKVGRFNTISIGTITHLYVGQKTPFSGVPYRVFKVINIMGVPAPIIFKLEVNTMEAVVHIMAETTGVFIGFIRSFLPMEVDLPAGPSTDFTIDGVFNSSNDCFSIS
jgi:hypothetical protein